MHSSVLANEMQVQIHWEFPGKFGFSNIDANLSLPLAFLPGMWMSWLDLQQPFCDSEVTAKRI